MSLVLLVAACLLSGAAIGLLGGILGIGGGLIAIPALGLVLGMDQQMAQGTALVMVLPTILMAVRKYNQHARIDLRVAACGALGAVVCTWFGAHLALGLDPAVLRRGFALFLLGIAVFYVWQTWSRPRPRAGAQPPPRGGIGRAQAGGIGALAGLLGGFFGVGGAVLAVPIMTAVFRLSQTAAQALALAMIIPGSCVALLAYALGGQTDWVVGLSLAAGSLALVPVGVRIAYGLPERALRGAFAAMLAVTVVLLFVES
ncbi:sulfite exporter TauE/SafE family protein [Orrella sp. JC864]|uniref:sulfite exporter TauE/SafE family protein n=1 Tax=Orrella sp. JC864 TaxID=3120298 RepID=UPI0012BBC7C5